MMFKNFLVPLRKKTIISVLNSGERETALSIFDVKKEHIYRYNLALEILTSEFENKESKGLDIFCANGYGTFFIAKFLKNTQLTGVDGCKEAISLAKSFYNRENTNYISKIYPFKIPTNAYDYIICLESIEHVSEEDSFLSDLYNALKPGGILIISTPNNDELPLNINPNQFHKKQYSFSELSKLVKNSGFDIKRVYGQNLFSLDAEKRITGIIPVKQRTVKPDEILQYIILHCQKKINP